MDRSTLSCSVSELSVPEYMLFPHNNIPVTEDVGVEDWGGPFGFVLQGLEAITQTWETTEFDIAPYKDKGHYKLRSATVEVFPA